MTTQQNPTPEPEEPQDPDSEPDSGPAEDEERTYSAEEYDALKAMPGSPVLEGIPVRRSTYGSGEGFITGCTRRRLRKSFLPHTRTTKPSAAPRHGGSSRPGDTLR